MFRVGTVSAQTNLVDTTFVLPSSQVRWPPSRRVGVVFSEDRTTNSGSKGLLVPESDIGIEIEKVHVVPLE